MIHSNARLTKEVDALSDAVLRGIHNSADAGLDNELGALHTGGVGHIYGGASAIIIRGSDLSNGICLGMEHISLRLTLIVLALVLKSRRSAIVPVGDDHLVLDDERSYVEPRAVRVFRPYTSHPEVLLIDLQLLLFLVRYSHYLIELERELHPLRYSYAEKPHSGLDHLAGLLA